jgi:CelD/BcsL family acetyltransferase involved in cellulose biosynthesis
VTLAVRRADLADPAECRRLEAWVDAQPGGTPFHLPAWSLAVAKGCRQRSHMLVAEAADGAIAGMLPLTEIASPLFGRALVSAGFGVAGGILVDRDAAVAPLAEAAWALAAGLKCPSVDLRGGP